MAKILVVDDETDLEILIRQKFRKKIRANEYEFVFAINGLDALSKIQAEPDIDVVLSDINMPELDGYGLYQLLKSECPEMLQHTGFMTGDTLSARSLKLFEEAECPYLEKPVRVAALRKFVSDILDKTA